MLKKAKAYIALIALVSTVKCDISVYTTGDQQLNIEFKDAQSLFGGDIPIEGIKVNIQLFYKSQMNITWIN